jgi:hypothetical protein
VRERASLAGEQGVPSFVLARSDNGMQYPVKRRKETFIELLLSATKVF